jgi:hypothetical protein
LSAVPHESPHFPVNMPHRVNRRLSDTTTNLQALIKSDAGTSAINSAAPIPEETPVAEIADAALEPAPVEAIAAEVLPPLPAAPVVAPVIPGDIRPTQRVPLRSETDGMPRSQLIRYSKSKSWIHRLIGG